MMARKTAYGVVIPAFNAAATILDALRSVMAQTMSPADIVVVDDGSNDATADLVADCGLPVRLLRQDNAGPGRATTAGFAALSTPLIATLDADDLWMPDKIARQIAHLDATPDCDGVFTAIAIFRNDDPGQRDGAPMPGWTRTTMLVRADVVQAVGPVLDPPGRRGEMIDWIARAREAGSRFDMLDEVLALRRIRPGSLSYGRDPARDRGYLEVARLAMLRRARARAGHEP